MSARQMDAINNPYQESSSRRSITLHLPSSLSYQNSGQSGVGVFARRGGEVQGETEYASELSPRSGSEERTLEHSSKATDTVVF